MKRQFSPREIEENPFLEWIDVDYGEAEHWYVPSAGAAKQILAHFDATPQDIINVSMQIGIWITDLWRNDLFEAFGIEVVEDHLILNGTVFPIVEHSEQHDRIIYVEGWMSLPHLDKWFSRVLHDPPNSNAQNPFNEFIIPGRATYLPDISYLPELYQELGVSGLGVSGLGVSGFDELGLTARSYANLFIDFQFSIDVGARIHYRDETIGALDRLDNGFEILYLERFPRRFIHHIQIFMANRQGAEGQLVTLARDPFQAITQRGLRGKDLIALCVSNPEINRKCNANDQAIFKERLRDEFQVIWKPDLWGFKSSRELYRQMHIKFFILVKFTINGDEHVIIVRDAVTNMRNIKFKLALVVSTPEFLEKSKNMQLTFVYIVHDPESSFIMEKAKKPISELITTKLPSYVTNHRFWSSKTPDPEGILAIILGLKYNAILVDIFDYNM